LKYRKQETQPLQQAKLITKHAVMHHTQIAEGIIDIDQGSKTSSTQSLSKTLDSSFLSVDEQGNIIPKTPEAALVAAQAYLHTTRPNPGDPREHMHQAAPQGLKMVGNKLSAKEEEVYRNKGTHKQRSPRRHGSPWHRSGSQ
jgi:hypothetical protein